MKKLRLLWRHAAYAFVACTLTLAPAVAEADAPAPRKAAAKFEIRSMQNMIDHHYMAVRMGELCGERANHAELLALCQQMVASQTAEIEQMQSWLTAWYGRQYQPRLGPGQERTIARLAALDNAQFEIAFMNLMIRHHSQAIRNSRLTLRRAFHSEVRQLATDMTQMQSQENRQMRTWLCEWYNICRGPMQAQAQAQQGNSKRK